MPLSACSLFKNSMEFILKKDIASVPSLVRGLYVLYNVKGEEPPRDPEKWVNRKQYKDRKADLVYVGIAKGDKAGIRGRLASHARSKSKKDKWTHFSVFEVWDNVTEGEIRELEGIFLHLYRKDSSAQPLNSQRGYPALESIRKTPSEWIRTEVPKKHRSPRKASA